MNHRGLTEIQPAEPELFLVDDDIHVHDLLSIVLSAAGYKLTSFSDGDSFLAAASRRIPACVLLDIHITQAVMHLGLYWLVLNQHPPFARA